MTHFTKGFNIDKEMGKSTFNSRCWMVSALACLSCWQARLFDPSMMWAVYPSSTSPTPSFFVKSWWSIMTIGHNLYSSSSWHDSCRTSSITEFTMILVILVHHGCVLSGVIKQNVPQRKLSRPIGHPQTDRAPKYWSWYPMVSFYHHRKELIFCEGTYTQACPHVDICA